MGHAHSIRENPGQIVGIAAFSAAIGALTAVLFTPRNGQEMRQGIGRRARYHKDMMMDKMHSKKEDIADTMDDITDSAKDAAAKAADKTKSAADKAKEKTDR